MCVLLLIVMKILKKIDIIQWPIMILLLLLIIIGSIGIIIIIGIINDY